MSGGGGGGDAFAEEPEAHENHERYLLTYADMITLLMALFIILYAIGQTDIAKFKRFQTGLQKQFGAPALDGGTGPLDGSQLTDSAPYVISLDTAAPGLIDPEKLKGPGEGGGDGSTGTAGATGATGATGRKIEITVGNADATARTITTVLTELGLPEKSLEVDVDDRGVIIRLTTDGVSFDSGRATLSSQAFKALDVVARAVTMTTNNIIIEGHTDKTPMAGPSGNWGLSADRAAAVLNYMTTKFGIAPDRMSVAAYADTRPLDTGDSPAALARNRRVEIVIALNPYNQAAVPKADPAFIDPAKPNPVNVGQITAARAAKASAASTATTTSLPTK